MAIVRRELKGGRISLWITFVDAEGKPVWERVKSGGERAAERLEAQRRRDVKAGTFRRDVKRAVSVRSWFDYFWTVRTNRTKENDKALIRDHVLSLEWFADMKLDDVRGKHCLGVVEAMREAGRLNEKSISTVYGIVSLAFARAAFEEVIPSDPSKLPKGTLKRKTSAANKRKPYARGDVLRVLGSAKDKALVFAALAFLSGMRTGEIAGRRFRDWNRDAKPLTAMSVHSQYNDQPLKGDDDETVRPRVVPVHPELEEVLRWWWLEGFEIVYARKPTPDDFILQTKTRRNLVRSKCYALFQSALKAAGVQNRTVHATRNTFISVARSNGAKVDILERVTHNASGAIVETAGTIDDYTEFEFFALCEAVACLDFSLDAGRTREVFARETGSSSWTRSKAFPAESRGTTGNSEEPPGTGGGAKSREIASPLAKFDARQRRLLKLAEIDPEAARPGLAICRARALAEAGDESGALAVLTAEAAHA